MTTHGHYRNGKPSPTYYSWLNMRIRCEQPSHAYYHKYGGAGISYDPRWKDFINFLADMGERLEGLTLERLDNKKDYSKENCRWATRAEQAQNTANTTMTMHKARLIRRMWKEGIYTQAQIGEAFNIQRHSVSMIVTNKCWKDNE